MDHPDGVLFIVADQQLCDPVGFEDIQTLLGHSRCGDGFWVRGHD